MPGGGNSSPWKSVRHQERYNEFGPFGSRRCQEKGQRLEFLKLSKKK